MREVIATLLPILREFGLPTLFCLWFMRRDERRYRDEMARWVRVEDAVTKDRETTAALHKQLMAKFRIDEEG